MLIIGVLAAIALPMFVGQQKKGQDGEAKENARNLVSLIESCYVETRDYNDCKLTSQLGDTGLPFVNGAPAVGEVGVTTGADPLYTVTAKSRSTNNFYIDRNADGTLSRRCDTADVGGCRSGGKW